MSCEFCDLEMPRVKLRRQYIHRVGWKNVICVDDNGLGRPVKRFEDTFSAEKVVMETFFPGERQ